MDFLGGVPLFYLLVAALLIPLYFLYLVTLPKPLPGIPYNKNATSTPLGDIPEMMRYVLRTKRVFVTTYPYIPFP